MSDDATPTPRNTHDISGHGDRYQALVEVLEHQASQTARDRARELEEARRRQDRRQPPYWIAGILLLITAWLWLFPPALLRVEPAAPPPIEEEEAALRFAMYLQAQRIKAYRLETGAYPDQLGDAGPVLPGMRYALLADGLYQLTGVTDRLTLTYQSDLPLDDFVGPDAEEVLGPVATPDDDEP